MISYAQNREDVVLARALVEPQGFYIDVGAASPVVHSVTKHFYDRGWHGVNVEPLERWHRELEEQRPRDVNLAVGLSDGPGTLDFFDVGQTAAGESTFSPEVAERLRERGNEPHVRTVEVETLATVCERYAREEIDFLKIDVEGWELQVLRGGDWERFRPIVLVVESTVPGTSEAGDPAVDAFIRDRGYLPGLFDGVNQFYLRPDRADLLPRLSVPANAIDDFIDAEVHDLRSALDRVSSEREAMVASWDTRLHTAAAQLRLAGDEVAAARRRASDAELQFHATRAALEQLIAQRATERRQPLP